MNTTSANGRPSWHDMVNTLIETNAMSRMPSHHHRGLDLRL